MNQLEQLRQYTTVVADTGNFRELAQFAPQDATTNPSLILKAVLQPDYAPLLTEAVAAHRGAPLEAVVDAVLVRFGTEILRVVPGRVSTEVDARLSFDTEATAQRARSIIALYQAAGVPRERVLIKIAATWEGIRAAAQLEREGIHCNLTLLFAFCQAVACGDAGSYGTTKADLTAQGKLDGLGYVINASRFSTDGYRDHSAATREQAFAKITTRPDPDSKLTFVVNGLWQHNTQDPLGLRWSTAQASPRSVEAAALTYNTRKSIDHLQGGVAYERRLGADLLQVSAYAGQRSVIQFQSIPRAVQLANPGHSGGIIDFDRNFYGIGARYIAVREAAGGKLTTTVGVDLDSSTDQRSGYQNFTSATALGVKGTLRRKETDTVESLDPYIQAEWARGDWAFTAGLRHSNVKFKVADEYITADNGNDSGSRSYRRSTPMLGVVYKLNPAINLYASAARGFETPTLNEMFYAIPPASGFNFGLKPSRSQHFEIGAKAFIGAASRVNVALFQIATEDELVVAASADGRTSYRNAGKTLRQGVEASFDTAWQRNLSSRFAVSHLRAIYDEAIGASVPAGNSLPGIPRTTLFGDLAWKPLPGITATVEAIYRSRVFVEDTNNAAGSDAKRPAPAYAIANLRRPLPASSARSAPRSG